MGSREEGKRAQERLCAQTFLRWFNYQRGTKYKLQRAERIPELNGRWDFVAQAPRNNQWIALEVKGLVIPQSLKLFGNWSTFCRLVTKELQRLGTVEGSFAIFSGIPWTFDQRQRNMMVESFTEVLNEVAPSILLGDMVNIGSEIASCFPDWPIERPDVDMVLWREHHIYKIIQRPKDIFIHKLDDTGCSVECDGIVSEVFIPDQALIEAILCIFETKNGRSAKPNEQLGDARLKGATGTFLLLDSHIRWTPNIVVQVLSSLNRALLSNIDAVYLVSTYNNRVKEVWHSSGERQVSNAI